MDQVHPISTLSSLDDDILVHIFSFFTISCILALRQTSRRMMVLSKLRIVWQNALKSNVIANGFPYPRYKYTEMDSVQLEMCTRRCFHVGTFWTSDYSHPPQPRQCRVFNVGCATPVTDVRFLSCQDHNLVVTVSKGIWSVVTCWDIGAAYSPSVPIVPKKVAEWSPRGVIISGLVANIGSCSDFTLAVSFNLGGKQLVEVLTLQDQGEGAGTSFTQIAQFETRCRPVLLENEFLAIGDDSVETHIINLRTGHSILLEGSNPPVDHQFQYNRCLRVVLADQSVFVVRARTLELFPYPTSQLLSMDAPLLRPIASHSFGWVDGIALSPQTHTFAAENRDMGTPYSIALRTESDDPWSPDVHSLDVYTLNPSIDDDIQLSSLPSHHPDDPSQDSVDNVDGFAKYPYSFPPIHQTSYASVRGFLRCPDIYLGAFGTAIWIQARPARNVSLTDFDVHSSETQGPHLPLHRPKESLVGALFRRDASASHLQGSTSEPRVLCVQESVSGSWSSLDYDEVRGRIAMGSGDGKVTLLEL